MVYTWVRTIYMLKQKKFVMFKIKLREKKLNRTDENNMKK